MRFNSAFEVLTLEPTYSNFRVIQYRAEKPIEVIWWWYLRERDHLQDLDREGRIIVL
jgi:hypothetical protein